MKKYEFRGEWLSVAQIAEATGLRAKVISDRIFSGRSGESLAEPQISRSEAAKRAKESMMRMISGRDHDLWQPETSVDEIARELGISSTMVNKIERSAIKKIKKKLAEMGITPNDLF